MRACMTGKGCTCHGAGAPCGTLGSFRPSAHDTDCDPGQDFIFTLLLIPLSQASRVRNLRRRLTRQYRLYSLLPLGNKLNTLIVASQPGSVCSGAPRFHHRLRNHPE